MTEQVTWKEERPTLPVDGRVDRVTITPAGQPKERVPFVLGEKARDNHSIPHEWAAWILAGMREDELAGKKPRPFSAWLSAACLHFAGMDGQ